MRTEQQVQDMLTIAAVQEPVSRARDYWQGVIDGLSYALGDLPDALQARLVAEQAAHMSESPDEFRWEPGGD